jgi:tetratricopeptide (TPR) repeat protein
VNEILNGAPQSPWGNLLAGMLCAAENNTDQALLHYKQAEISGPNMPKLHTRIGQIFLQKKDWLEAEESFLKALEIDGDSAGAFRGLGISLYHQQNYEKSVDNLLRSVALMHQQPLAHFHLGLAFMAIGKLDDAIRVLNIALEMKPELVTAHNALVKIYEQKEEKPMELLHRSKAHKLNSEVVLS